ncbi:hypothetical protein FGO68_gene3236 [Halteria grandinella]|uniref:Uncharacterized protein n=1 Tax=Halteria grandinella TaxID=5974 RepID=A0A8J8T9G0_HALGN|nr:hypothetical protein FGO68_gene3236 [Halteria grandinella]
MSKSIQMTLLNIDWIADAMPGIGMDTSERETMKERSFIMVQSRFIAKPLQTDQWRENIQEKRKEGGQGEDGEGHDCLR